MSTITDKLEGIRIDNLAAAKVYKDAIGSGGNPSNRELTLSIMKIHLDIVTIAFALKRLIDPTGD